MQTKLFHEQLDLYKIYLDVVSLCEDIISSALHPIIAFDHLDRALESIGLNFMRANVQAPGSAQRSLYLDFSIASAHECAAALDVAFAKRAIEEGAHTISRETLWRIRGMLLGLKRVCINKAHEESVLYGSSRFPFMKLDMYRTALEVVRWTHDLVDELPLTGRVRQKLDVSTTGTVLNIAEGHGRATVPDQNRFMKTAQEHTFQTLMLLDLMVARGETLESRIVEGKVKLTRIVSMLHGWCTKNEQRNRQAKLN